MDSGVSICRNAQGNTERILAAQIQKKEQFRLKKPGGVGVKLFQAILAVNNDHRGTPVTLPLPALVMEIDLCYTNG